MEEAIIICLREKLDKPQNQTVLFFSFFSLHLSVFFPPRAERAENLPRLLTLGGEVVAGWLVGVVTYLHRVEAKILFGRICEGNHRLNRQPATKTKRDERHMFDLCQDNLLASHNQAAGCSETQHRLWYMVCIHWALCRCRFAEANHFNALHLHN